MSTLYVDRNDVTLELEGGALQLRVAGERLQTVPVRLLERVVLRADTRLTSGVLAGLADMGVGVLALGGRGGQRVAHILGAPNNDARVRIAQCQMLGDEVFAIAWSRQIVRAKLRQQHRVIVGALSVRLDLRKPLCDARDTLALSLERLGGAADRAAVRGLEGGAAAAYFRGFKRLFPESLEFEGRRRRPPPDPVNACLSLGYTLLHSQAVRACWAAGLDPMVGFLHMPLHGRASMACDLMEPWRALVDRWVWAQFRERALRGEHFGRDGAGACLLAKAGRAHFYSAWTPLQQQLTVALRRQARLCARRLADAAVVPADDEFDLDDAAAGFELTGNGTTSFTDVAQLHAGQP